MANDDDRELGTSVRASQEESWAKRLDLVYDEIDKSLAKQEADCDGQRTKVTYLFGLIVSLVAAYTGYATHVNVVFEGLGLSLWAVSLIFLSRAYQNHMYYRPALPQVNLELSPVEARYQDVADIRDAYEKNVPVVNDISAHTTRGVLAFEAGIMLLGLSFIF